MENTEIDRVFPADFRWADISNWDAAYRHIATPDPDGNAIIAGHSLLLGSRDCILITDREDKLLAVSGLEDYLVIDTEDVLMICPRDERKVKDITTHIGLPEYEDFR